MAESPLIRKLRGIGLYPPPSGVGEQGPEGPQGPPGSAADAWPVGAIFISANDQNPSALLGFGTWTERGAGRVLVGKDAGDAAFDAVAKTGGAKTVASAGTVAQPTFTGTQATLTHSGTAVSAHSGAAVADHAAHTHSYTQVPNHKHALATGTGATGNFSQVIGTVDTSSGGTGAAPTQTALGTLSADPVGGVASGTTGNPSATLTHSVTQPGNHTVTQPNDHTYTPAGTVSQPTFTGSPTSVLQPFFVVRFWERTA